MTDSLGCLPRGLSSFFLPTEPDFVWSVGSAQSRGLTCDWPLTNLLFSLPSCSLGLGVWPKAGGETYREIQWGASLRKRRRERKPLNPILFLCALDIVMRSRCLCPRRQSTPDLIRRTAKSLVLDDVVELSNQSLCCSPPDFLLNKQYKSFWLKYH